jgi:hypothetical protein
MGVGILGLSFLIAGLFSLVYGHSFFCGIVLKKMAIE